MLNAELERHRINESRKWNFDFDREVPLDAKGRYEWCPLTPTKEHCKRPEKRPAVVEEDNICHLYACSAEEIRRPNEENMSVSPVVEKLAACKTQTVITGMFIPQLKFIPGFELNLLNWYLVKNDQTYCHSLRFSKFSKVNVLG